MAEMSPKTILNMLLTALRAWTGAPLATCAFRKGPQRAARLGTATALVIVGLEELEGGEQSPPGGMNHWWENWAVAIRIAVPDDEDDPEGTEDTRLDLVDQIGQFIHATRTLYDAETGAASKRGRITSCTLWAGGGIFDDDQQVYRGADVRVVYGTLRS